MPHPPTDEQSTIISATTHSGSSLMIRAYAGCAKSTTLEMSAPGIKQPALSLAFNKKIADELRPRLPANFTTKTLNGFGHGAWLRHINVRSPKLDATKLGKLVTATAKDFRLNLPSWQWDAVRQLATKAMLAGIAPDDEGQPLLPDTRENWYELDDLSPQDDRELTQELAHQVLSTSIALARQGHISFDDQIYCPTILGAPFPQYPVIFVDESQDLSSLNHQMLRRACGPNTRLVVVGDPFQAIYAFRGADSSSMDNMRRLRQGWEDLSLTLTFRCPKTIVARQQHHAPGFQAYRTNQEGSVLHYPPEGGAVADETTPSWSWSHVTSTANNLSTSTIAILCRNNAPLLSLAFKLLRRGIGCQVLGRDIGQNLQNLTKKLFPDDETPVAKCIGLLVEWQQREGSLARLADKPAKAESIDDKAESLLATIEGASPTNAGEIRAMLSKLFSRDSDPIILSSIHKAKGLEWPLVIHLDPWRIPSIQAKKSGSAAALQQEANLLYVCETRTKHTLINANLKEFL